MRLSVRCEGGPPEYAGRVWADVESDDAGYVLLPPPGADGPEAWYRIDPPPEESSSTSRRDARPARYVADYLPS